MHNLCKEKQLPLGTKNIIGLGLKFCTAPTIPTPNIRETLQKLAYKIRTKHYLESTDRNEINEYIPQLYKKIKGWNPPPATLQTEHQISNFENNIRKATLNNTLKHQKFFNLTESQRKTLKELKKSTDIIILPSDKNLGPAILDRKSYITQILNKHILTPSYQQLSPTEAKQQTEFTKTQLMDLYNHHKNMLSKAEVDYFRRSVTGFHRNPIFYSMLKVHKAPVSFQPVVNCINSFPLIFSTWLDFCMKQLLKFIPSYVKDSKSLISELRTLDIPSGAKLFTADATAMYTNIDVDTGLMAFRTLFNTYKDSIPQTFPTEFFLSTLDNVMKNNIFTYGDTFWSQVQGTAMGTPAAPLYSIITFGVHENTQILNNFQQNIFFYRRYIDDILGIWVEASETEWLEFKKRLNQFGTLKWNIEELTKNTNFLDLQISIKDNKMHTTTFQKDMNLYTYIPPLSAHPNSCYKGLITGEILRYWCQNSNRKDITSLFIQRLVNRGHQISDIVTTIMSAVSSIYNAATGTYNQSISNQERPNNDNTLYIHWRYHPYDISNYTIRNVYNATLKGTDGFSQMRIALSRHKNLREISCRSQLDPSNTEQVSKILNSLTCQRTQQDN